MSNMINNLQRREIQAPLVACLLREFAAEIGYDKTIALATSAIQKDAMANGRMMAEKYSGSSFKELLHIVQEVWAEDGALEYNLIEQSDQKLSFDVHRCRYAELYDRLGVKEFGYCLSCCRDEAFTWGFNPRMRLLRTQTIMEGSAFCDFRFILE